jgi:hypothetical protein
LSDEPSSEELVLDVLCVGIAVDVELCRAARLVTPVDEFPDVSGNAVAIIEGEAEMNGVLEEDPRGVGDDPELLELFEAGTTAAIEDRDEEESCAVEGRGEVADDCWACGEDTT